MRLYIRCLSCSKKRKKRCDEGKPRLVPRQSLIRWYTYTSYLIAAQIVSVWVEYARVMPRRGRNLLIRSRRFFAGPTREQQQGRGQKLFIIPLLLLLLLLHHHHHLLLLLLYPRIYRYRSRRHNRSRLYLLR